MITPIKDKLIFIFKVFTKLFVLPLSISFVNICDLLAPNDFISIILDLSVLENALYIPIIVVNTDINRAIKIIDFVFAPIQIIINGPSDIFGSEFSTVRYGSSIFEVVLLHHSILATRSPIRLASEKLSIVSYSVIPMCNNKLSVLNSSIVVFITIVGYDVKNGFIISSFAVISHIIRNIDIINILKSVIILLFLFSFFKNSLCSLLYMVIKFFPYFIIVFYK